MISTDAARTAVGVLGNVIALFLFLSPMPTFIKIWKKGSVEQYSATPYLATFLNCMVWVLYGLPIVKPNSMLVITINGAGVFIEIVYLTLYMIFTDRKKRSTVAIIAVCEIAFIGGLGAFTILFAHTHERRTLIVGIVSIVFNVIMYASPLSVMILGALESLLLCTSTIKMVISTQSVEYMPLSLSIASFANGACWLTYALIRFDPFIAVPNGVGTLFSVVQLALYARYYKSTQRQLAERNEKLEMGLADVVVSGASNKTAQNGSRVAQTRT